jgi:hypothetical protein
MVIFAFKNVRLETIRHCPDWASTRYLKSYLTGVDVNPVYFTDFTVIGVALRSCGNKGAVLATFTE